MASLIYRGVAQMEAQRTFNPWVVSSSLTTPICVGVAELAYAADSKSALLRVRLPQPTLLFIMTSTMEAL